MHTPLRIALLAMLNAPAACTAAVQPLSPEAQSARVGPMSSGISFPVTVRRDSRISWISPDAKTAGALLFESDPASGDVDIFSLPDLAHKGRLTGFSAPLGECSDSRGDVWVVNFGLHELDEFSHGGAPLGKITSPTYYLWSCAVSPRDGTIAITILNRPHSRPGEVLLYSSPSAKPRILRNPEQAYDFFAAFDPSGTLWVDGSDVLGHFILSKCGGKKCATMNLTGGSIFSAGAVVWDDVAGGLVIFDTTCRDIGLACSYPVTTAGDVGPPSFYETHGDAAPCALRQAALMRSGSTIRVVGADNEAACGSSKQSTADLWAYPNGNRPLKYHKEGAASPFGAAVSVKR
ncbi:MAG: hypothetical protein JO030_03795 [Candidatus Eremiobacteraeota bacterium]|nr:hypothetical protein [Candidatus Eremiobacteraeota bacterium]